jgi:putative ABC transport system ATP-binding protein
MINLYSISKIYHAENRECVGLKNITLSIQKGDFVAITGRDGSGKSTLMDILAMLERATFGKYVFENEDISLMDEDHVTRIRNSKVGVLYQKPNFIEGLSLYQNLELPLLYRGIDSKEREKIIEKNLEGLGLQEKINFKIGTLTRGNQQLFALCRALLNEGNLILADEPTGDLDTLQTEEMLGIFQSLNAKGMTIVYATNDIDIARHAKRVILLRDGLLTKDISLNNPLSAREIKERFQSR